MKHKLAQGAVIVAMLWLAVSDFANSRLPERPLSSLEPAAGKLYVPDPLLFYERPGLLLERSTIGNKENRLSAPFLSSGRFGCAKAIR